MARLIALTDAARLCGACDPDSKQTDCNGGIDGNSNLHIADLYYVTYGYTVGVVALSSRYSIHLSH